MKKEGRGRSRGSVVVVEEKFTNKKSMGNSVVVPFFF